MLKNKSDAQCCSSYEFGEISSYTIDTYLICYSYLFKLRKFVDFTYAAVFCKPIIGSAHSKMEDISI